MIEERGVLIAADTLSDVLIPLLDFSDTADPIEDYLAALRLIEDAAHNLDVVIPGHGSPGEAGQIPARIEQDRAYLGALHDGQPVSDSRVGPSATYDFMAGVHERQLQNLARRREN